MGLKPGADYIGVSCVFWCHDGKENILFSKRSQNCKDEQGWWECGGGSMEFGETFEDAVRRELLEEYRVEPLELERITTYNLIRTNAGQKTHWIIVVYAVLVDPTKVQNGEPEKIDEIRWCAIDNAPKPLHSAMDKEIPLIKKWFSEKK